ncbi:MAG: D-alanyl-D-alanine carboxypeptidase/D-alanyl-D-alanine-endopeptidase [Gammaproteobacteria bacterium]|nr:D-alanyl-D-alanine carboxypeptidase/D-alanyl-D-alanine-endopeptidase [Gammaproteobacteria bacterium]
MKIIINILSLIFCITIHPTWAAPLKNDINQLLNRVDSSTKIGALVVDLNTGETLYSRNASKTFIPASNMKLFSDAAALLALGPNYRFQTELSTNAHHLKQGTLEGSIYLYLPGDPSFDTQDLQQLLTALKNWNIKRIKGNVVLVSNRRGITPYAPGWTKKDLIYSYGAPLAPLVLDENRLIVTVNPAARVGENALIELKPANNGIKLNNEVTTKAKPAGCGLSYLMDSKNQLTVRGCIGIGQWSAQQKLAIKNPSIYAKAQIRTELSKLGIQLDGKITYGRKPTRALLLAKHQSKTISQLLADTLKTSDNLYADSLYLHTAAVLNGSPVNWAGAQSVLKKFLQEETGIALKKANFTDGSGLSRQDKLTPKQTVELLQFLYSRFPLAYEYIAALPVAGRDGTLKKRLKKPSQKGFVRAKTGTMNGIVSLSGYLYTANAHTLAFAIYINKGPKTQPKITWRYPSLVDALCDFFLKQHPKEPESKPNPDAHARVAFQHHSTQAELIQEHTKKWRHIELALKRALRGKPVAVIYRGDHVILDDQSKDTNTVWHALQSVNKKYPFSAALHAKTSPPRNAHNPSLLWIQTTKSPTTRTWTLRDSAG